MRFRRILVVKFADSKTENREDILGAGYCGYVSTSKEWASMLGPGAYGYYPEDCSGLHGSWRAQKVSLSNTILPHQNAILRKKKDARSRDKEYKEY